MDSSSPIFETEIEDVSVIPVFSTSESSSDEYDSSGSGRSIASIPSRTMVPVLSGSSQSLSLEEALEPASHDMETFP